MTFHVFFTFRSSSTFYYYYLLSLHGLIKEQVHATQSQKHNLGLNPISFFFKCKMYSLTPLISSWCLNPWENPFKMGIYDITLFCHPTGVFAHQSGKLLSKTKEGTWKSSKLRLWRCAVWSQHLKRLETIVG